MSLHVQCALQRGNENTVRWIPKSKARIGSFIDLTEKDKSISRGWCVVQTYSELPTEVVLERENDHKKHRSATDI